MGKRRTDTQPQETRALEAITPVQQTFIEQLLCGKKICEAALTSGISRRTAAYWLADPSNPICLEYEKQRIQQQQNFSSRIANLHMLTLKVMEDALSEEAPLATRFAAAKFLYEAHLARFCNLSRPESALGLAKEEAGFVDGQNYFNTFERYHLRDIPDD